MSIWEPRPATLRGWRSTPTYSWVRCSSPTKTPTGSTIAASTTTTTTKRKRPKGRYAVGEATRSEHPGDRDGRPGPRCVRISAGERHDRPGGRRVVRRRRRLRRSCARIQLDRPAPFAARRERRGNERSRPGAEPGGKPGLQDRVRGRAAAGGGAGFPVGERIARVRGQGHTRCARRDHRPAPDLRPLLDRADTPAWERARRARPGG